VYTEVLNDLMADLKKSAANRETAKTAVIGAPSIEEFCEQRRGKRKPTDDTDKRAKKTTAFITGVDDPQLLSKPEVSTRNFFAPLRSN
jgi:hypothetical protein